MDRTELEQNITNKVSSVSAPEHFVLLNNNGTLNN